MLIALTFATALVVGLVATPIVRGYAHGQGLLDQPGGRKVHQRRRFRASAAWRWRSPSQRRSALRLFVSPGPRAVGGLRPNRVAGHPGRRRAPGRRRRRRRRPRHARAWSSSPFQVAAAVVAWWLGLSIDRLHLPWAIVELGILSLPITVAWIVGVINAINLIDGLDGLAAGRGPDRPRRFRPARGRRRRRSDPAAHRRHGRRGGRLPRLQPAPGDRSSWATPDRCSSASWWPRSRSR